MPRLLPVMFGFLILLNCLLYGYIKLPYIDSVIDAPAKELSATRISSLEFEIVADASQTTSGWLALAQVQLPSGVCTNVWVALSEEPKLGDILRFVGRFVPNDESDWAQSSRAQGIVGKVRAFRVASRSQVGGIKGPLIHLRALVLENISPETSPSRALLAGVLCGYKTAAKSSGLHDVFARAGISHLIAVSGSHLVLVATLLEGLLDGLGFSRKQRYWCSCLTTFLYVLFCAVPRSAMRSWVMFAITRASFFFKRRAEPLSALALCGIAFCILDPFCAADIGFQLSVLCVCALVMFSEWLDCVLASLQVGSLFASLTRRMPYKVQGHIVKVALIVRRSLAATLVCQLATFGCCAYVFGSVSLVAPLANVLIGPLFSFLMMVGLCAAILAWIPLLGPVVVSGAAACSSLIYGLASCLAAIPFASLVLDTSAWVQLLPFVMGMLLYVCWPRPSRSQVAIASLAFMLCCAVWLVFATVLVPAQVVVLDVGQGDAILVRDGRRAVLVDTGPQGAVAESLARNTIYSLDAIVLTHLHDDHYGGTKEILETMPVGALIVAEGVGDDIPEEILAELQAHQNTSLIELKRGDSFKVGEFSCTCLWPQEQTDGSENKDSICLLVETKDEFKMLLTGDAESDVLEKIENYVGDIDVLKVGHHGSEVSITSAEAALLKPELALASAGKDNSYGHPSTACIQILKEAGAKVLSTIECGDIAILPYANTISVHCQK